MPSEFKVKNGLIVADGQIKFVPLSTAGLVINSETGVISTGSLGQGLSFSSSTLSLSTQLSITTDPSGLKLVNDTLLPGNSKYYGTDSGGTRGWFALPSGSGGITSIGPSGSLQTGNAITLVTGTSGTDFNISASTDTITFNIPDAGSGVRGLVSTNNQTFVGIKTFNNGIISIGDITTNATTENSNFAAAPLGFNVTGSSLLIGGASEVRTRILSRGSSIPTLNIGASYSTFIIGTQSLTEAASGTHSIVTQLAIKPLTIIDGVATTTNSATLYIENAATGATNNYALWVDSGTARLDGEVELQGISSATKTNILYYDSTTKRISYGATPGGGSGITSIGPSGSLQTGSTITLATGTSGTDFNISAATDTITFNIPDAGQSNRGFVSTGTQTFAGPKTFNGNVAFKGLIATDSNWAIANLFAAGNTPDYFSTSSTTWDLLSASGGTGARAGMAGGGTNQTPIANTSQTGFHIANMTIPKNATGTHPLFSQLSIKPLTIGTGAATVTNSATLYIENAATGATNNYALWVDSGNVRFDGNLVGDDGNYKHWNLKTNPVDNGVFAYTLAGTLSTVYSRLSLGGFGNYTIPVDGTYSTLTVLGDNLTEAASSTHALISTAAFTAPIITNGVATTTNAATVYIKDAPSNATNIYALWVDSGNVQFDGSLTVDGQVSVASNLNAKFNSNYIIAGSNSGNNISITLAGSSANTNYRSYFKSPTLTLGVSDSVATVIIDSNSSGITEAASGTHNLISQLAVKPITITDGSAITTNNATVYIEGAGSGAANNYALWVDSGNVQFDSNLYVGSTITANGYISTSQYVTTNNRIQITDTATAVTSKALAGATADVSTYFQIIPTSVGGIVAGRNFATIFIDSTTAHGEAGSGSHNLVSQVAIKPVNLTDNTATTTNGATLYIEGAATGTATITNNYALWVDAGDTKLDGRLLLSNAVFNDTTATYGITLSTAANVISNTVLGSYAFGTLNSTNAYAQVVFNAISATAPATAITVPLIANVALKAPILASGTGTITNSATLYIEGSSATAGNNYSLWVDNGVSRFDGDVTLIGPNFGQLIMVKTGTFGLAKISTDSNHNGILYLGRNSSANASHNVTFSPDNLTGTRTVYVPNADGTLALNQNSAIGAGTATDGYYLKLVSGVPTWASVASGGITSIGPSGSLQTGSTITLATGTSGTDFNISAATDTITFNIPNASGTSRGLVTSGAQTFGGLKTFASIQIGGAGAPDVGFAVDLSGSSSSHSALQLLSTSTTYQIIERSATSVTLGIGKAFGTHIIGTQDVTEAASGTHPLLAQLALKPLTITNGAAATTNSATVYIEGAATGATNNYALWVDTGTTRLDGDLAVGYNTVDSSTMYASSSLIVNRSVASVQLLSTGIDAKIIFNNYSNVSVTAGNSYAGLIIGTGQPITTAATITHPLLSQLAIKVPTVSSGGATVTNTATLYVEGAMSGGANNYALWVDSGDVRFDGSIFTGTTFSSGSFSTASTPKAIAGYGLLSATNTNITTLFRGSTFNNTSAFNYTNVLINGGTVTEDTSGTHPLVAQLAIQPLNIIDGTATTTNSATLYIENAASGATNNYALWVDDGVSRFDGNISAQNGITVTGANLVVGGMTLVPGAGFSLSQTWGGVTASTKYRFAATQNYQETLSSGTNYVTNRFDSATDLIEAATGTHGFIAQVGIKALNLTDGGATTTNAATLYVEGPTTGTATITNNYALWVDAGTVRLDGEVELQGISNSTKTNVLYYDSTTKRISYGATPGGGSGITSIGPSGSLQTGSTITLATGTSGTDFNISAATDTITFNIPDASDTARGLVSTNTQTFGGDKTFIGNIVFDTQLVSFKDTGTNYNYNGSPRVLIGSHEGVFPDAGDSYLGSPNVQSYIATLPESFIADIGASFATISMYGRTLTEAASGTHTFISQLAIKAHTITNGSALTTNAATVYIEGAAGGTATITNNYALWVDAGNVRVDGNTIFSDGTTTTPSAKIHAISTTEQLRLNYDSSNYASFTVSSSGDLTIAAANTKNIEISRPQFSSSMANLYIPAALSAYNEGGASYQIGGATSTQFRISLGGGQNTTIPSNNGSSSGVLIPKITMPRGSSGTHPLFAGLAVKAPDLTGNTTATTAATTVYIENAPTNNGGVTNSYALWIDAGTVRLDGTLELQGISSSTTSNVLYYDSTTKQVTYGAAPTGSGGYTTTTTTSATYNETATSGEKIILCNAASNAITVNLPAVASNAAKIIIKKIDSSTNTITVDGNAAETIDGGTTAIIRKQYESITLVTDGSAWYII